jgi:hypothetical protein
MVGGLHIPIWNRTEKSFTIALSGVGRELRGRDDEGNVNNIHYYLIRIVTMNLPLHNEWMILKNL